MCSSNRKGSAAPRRSFKRNAAPVNWLWRECLLRPRTHPLHTRSAHGCLSPPRKIADVLLSIKEEIGGRESPYRDMPSRPVSIVEPCASNVSSTREIPFEGHPFDVPARGLSRFWACPEFGPIWILGTCRISGPCRNGVSGSGAISRPARGGVGHRCSG